MTITGASVPARIIDWTVFIAEGSPSEGAVQLATAFDVPGSFDNESFFAGEAKYLDEGSVPYRPCALCRPTLIADVSESWEVYRRHRTLREMHTDCVWMNGRIPIISKSTSPSST
jgi:hypothetical protein